MSLHITIGSEYSGKTTTLITEYSHNKSLNKIIISYDKTTRDENDHRVSITGIESHDGLIAPNSFKLNRLNDLMDSNNYQIFSKDVLEYYISVFEDAEYIYIDDAHSYSDLKDFVLNMNSYGKHVYIYGLDSDKNNNKIGEVWDTIPYASSIKKLQQPQ